MAKETAIALVILGAIFAITYITKNYRHKNIFTYMTVYLILEPIVFTMFTWLSLAIITKENEYVVVFSPFILIPLASMAWLLLDHKDLVILQKAKIALEWNQAIAASISLAVAIYLLLTPNTELQFIGSLFSAESLQKEGFGYRDAFNLLFLSISFPFVISFTLSKALVEHLIYRLEAKVRNIE